MREVLWEYKIPRMACVLEAVWGRKRWEVYVSLNSSYFSGITERTKGRVRRLGSRLRRVPLWNRGTTKYLGWGWWGGVEGFHREENVELENALMMQHSMIRFLNWCVIPSRQYFVFANTDKKLLSAYMSGSWEYRTLPAQRAWPCCRIGPAQWSVLTFCKKYHSNTVWFYGHNKYKNIHSGAFSHSPYLSQEKQFLWSVQDSQ